MSTPDAGTPRTDAVDRLSPQGEPATDYDYRRMRNLAKRLEHELTELRELAKAVLSFDVNTPAFHNAAVALKTKLTERT